MYYDNLNLFFYTEFNPYIMKFTLVKDYQIKLNDVDYIVVDGIEFENHRFYPNLRSIRVRLNDQEYSYNEICEDIRFYLQSQFNVNLINLVSRRELNKNWFECYGNDDFGSMLRSQHAQILINLLDSEGHIIITELYKTKTLLINEHKYETEFPEYPIWHINGNHKTNAKYCPLYCHYEIMMHILSLKFESISEQIMALTSNEFQKAALNNENVENIIIKSKEELIEMIRKLENNNNIKDQKIFNLEECMRDIKEQNIKIQQQHEESKKENKDLRNTIDSMNAKIDAVLESNKHLNAKLDHHTDILRKIDSKVDVLNGKAIDNAITNSVHEIAILVGGSKNRNFMKFINICRQTNSDLDQEIQKYLDQGYKIKYRSEVPNGMSTYKYVFENTKHSLRYNIKKIKNTQRNYITDWKNGLLLIGELKNIINSYLNVPLDNIRGIIKEELEPVKAELKEIKQELNQLPEKLRNLNITAEIYYGLEGKFVKASNNRYYEVLKDDDGILYCNINKKHSHEEILKQDTSIIKYKNNLTSRKINEVKL